MTDTTDRVHVAQWILDKQLGWIGAADAKAATLVALDTAAFAALAALHGAAQAGWCTRVASLAASAVLVVAVVCAAMSLFPRTDGPKQSLVFFGPVAAKASADYVAELSAVPLDQMLGDIAAQIHRNAEIAKTKHRWVRASMRWSFLAALPWVAAIYLLVMR